MGLVSGLQAKSEKEIAVTGCLQQGSEPNTYVLLNVMSASQGSNQTPSQMARSEGSFSYLLMDAKKHDARSFVGQRVLINGINTTYESTNQGDISSPPATGNLYGQPALRVMSIQKSSGTCP
jgi:hypothetical protein